MSKPTSPPRTEFSSALAQVAHERNLDPQIVLDAIRQAILAAFKKDHPTIYKEDYVYEVDLDPGSGEAKIFATPGETYEEAGVSAIRPLPGASRLNVTPPGFGRIAAQTAKQVIIQKVREAEKSNLIAECEKRLGSLISGTVLRTQGGEVVVEIDMGKHGRVEAVMPREDQVHTENYHLNQHLTLFLHSLRDGPRGREVIVSRADTGIIRELFRREVPEVNSGSVEIKHIARDPGSRTKIAVYSHQSGVDPVGSCVGQKGVRVQAVIGELNGEKIDIIQYSDDLQKFVAAALAPAANLTVKIDVKKQQALVLAPPDQLSLAIGREGQNAKLAGRLTNLRIDIKGSDQPAVPEEEASEKKTTSQPDQ